MGVKRLFEVANSFQKDTVLQWSPIANKPTLSVYLGLIDINEAAPKECGTITLDLLLRAGVLISHQNGSWLLAGDWNTRRIYLVGDTTTIENMTKFVCDM